MLVSVLPLQQIYLKRKREGYTDVELAVAAGWFKPGGQPDGERVRRSVGLDPCTDIRGNGFRKHVTTKTAVELLNGLHSDPVDIEI